MCFALARHLIIVEHVLRAAVVKQGSPTVASHECAAEAAEVAERERPPNPKRHLRLDDPCLCHRSARQHAAVLVVQFDRLSAANEFGEPFVRRHDREAVEFVDACIADHVLVARFEQKGVPGLDHGLDRAAARDPLPVQHIEEFVGVEMRVGRCGAAGLENLDDDDLGKYKM